MNSMLLIVVSVMAGVLLARTNLVPANTQKGVNMWVLYVALPALILRYIPGIEWNAGVLLPVAGSILVLAGAWVFSWLFCRISGASKSTRTALFVTSGLGNTAFVGYPLISAYYGEGAIKDAIVFDQMTFILFATVGVLAVMRGANPEAKASPVGMIKTVLKFPVVIALIASLVVPLFADISVLNPLFDKLLATLSPMALFSIGLQLRFAEWRKEKRNLAAGMSYKLIIAPALVFLLAWILGSRGSFAKVNILEAAMPTHITMSLLAAQYNLNPQLCNLMATLGIVAAALTTIIWRFVLDGVF